MDDKKIESPAKETEGKSETEEITQAAEGKEKDSEDLEFLSEDDILNAGSTASLSGVDWALELPDEERGGREEAGEDVSEEKAASALSKKEKKKMSPKQKKKLQIALAAAAAACIIGIYLGFAGYYSGHLFPGTNINGIDCKNYVPAMALSAIENADKYYELEIIGRGGALARIGADDIELHKVYTMTVDDVKRQQNEFLWFTSLWAHHDYVLEGSVSFNGVLLDQALDRIDFLQPENMKQPENAHIGDFDAARGGFYIEPETEGTLLDGTLVRKAVGQAVLDRKTQVDLEEYGCYLTAEITSGNEMLVQEVAKLNSITKARITYQFGDAEEVVDGGVFYEWLDERTRRVNEEKVALYLTALAEKYDTYGVREDFTTLQGYKLNLPKGKFGWKMDVEAETAQLCEEINNGVVATRTPAFTYEGGGWGENDIGDFYIEIDLTNQMVYVVDHGKVILDTPCVTGNVKSGNSTPAGIFGVTYRQTNATLRGADYASFVNYWMPFNGNIGMHDATWRGVFGGEIYKTRGSHGCVNLPKAKASKIFSMVYKNCPVICYYLTDEFIVEYPEQELEIVVEGATPSPSPTPVPSETPSPSASADASAAPSAMPEETEAPSMVPTEMPEGIPHETTPEEAAAQAAAEAAAQNQTVSQDAPADVSVSQDAPAAAVPEEEPEGIPHETTPEEAAAQAAATQG